MQDAEISSGDERRPNSACFRQERGSVKNHSRLLIDATPAAGGVCNPHDRHVATCAHHEHATLVNVIPAQVEVNSDLSGNAGLIEIAAVLAQRPGPRKTFGLAAITCQPHPTHRHPWICPHFVAF